MKLNFRKSGNHTYASIPGKSYREDGKVKKEPSVYLGRVVDRENNVFFSKERGLFTYDAETETYGEADPSYTGTLKSDKRRKVRLCLDFGDSFFLDKLFRETGYNVVLDSVGYSNKDTLWGMAQYYVLTNLANMHAGAWYEGNFVRLLYPQADLHSQRISKLLSHLGQEETLRSYFAAHIDWLRKNVCDDPAIIVDSTGLPNSIKMNLTQTNSHNGKISNEARMITALQRDSGYPLMFRAVPGNIVDVTTLSTTITVLAEYGVHTDLALLDAGYVSSANMSALLGAGIDFVARLPEQSGNLYKEIVRRGEKNLIREENLISFNGRYVYAKQVECRIDEYPAYAFLCYDVDASGDENHKAIKRSRKKKASTSDMHRFFQKSGIFVILASLPFQPDDILDVYYTRQQVEQYFDLGKGLARLIPLRVHNEDRVLGHLLLSQIAATVNLYIQKKMRWSATDSVEMFLGLRNQKCAVYSTRIVPNEPQSAATQYYNKFKIKCPTAIDTRGSELRPIYGL